MDKTQFGELVNRLVLTKEMSGSGGPGLRIVDFNGSPYYPISAYNSPDSIAKTRFGIDESVYVKPFDKIIDSLAKTVKYMGDPKEFHAASVKDVNRHCVDLSKYRKQHGIYIRIQGDYNNHGSKNGARLSRKGGTHTLMENRKVKLTLITLVSAATLTLQITGAKKDATAWTNFIDADNSPSEYDGGAWTKDVASKNQAAVDAVNKMISIEEDYAAGKLEKDAALEQFKEAYVEWVIAHLSTNPDFVERRIIGLNVEDPMAAYKEA